MLQTGDSVLVQPPSEFKPKKQWEKGVIAESHCNPTRTSLDWRVAGKSEEITGIIESASHSSRMSSVPT